MKGSKERAALESALQHRQSVCEEIPVVIDGKEYWTKDVQYQTMVKFCKIIQQQFLIHNYPLF